MEKILEIINPEYLVPILIGCIAMDILFGIFKALKSGTFEAKKMVAGLEKQVYIAIPVVVAFMFDLLIKASNGWFMNMTCLFYICYELGSIFENLGEVNFPLPKFLKDMFKVLQKGDVNIVPEVEEDKENSVG